MIDSVLSFANLSKTISAVSNRIIFAQIAGTVLAGEKIVFVGPSGQGKSTLLRILGLLDEADSGEMVLLGRPLHQWDPQAWRMNVCYVSQTPVMLEGTVEDNLRTVSRLHHAEYDPSYAAHLLSSVGLEEMGLSKEASTLSGGEKQRVALVRSLLLRPKLLLLDEITSSLDDVSKYAVERLITDINRQEGTGYVWISHDRDQAARIGEKVWSLSNGTLSEGGVSCL
ncbi:putative ABC transport system ATP-binding protein [Paenibacillus rhizosphaerae]|uniref:Putative ABC transport system ATP-binding protein n=1 Tax=Paenibacillus rhizosphaerae TaxID=297318 RepID=A0A839TJ43_9BACL|nr:ATP-binding cassette domain-containing protein [Paenibacillus rhizosphaerae]MBB3126754.1 putative ABC transport system ATP-binding protein [Paenibacillus rhizosphaerae]